MIHIKNLNKTFGEKESRVEALKQVNLQINKGDYIKVLGPSGSGKSTLLNILAGLLHPSNGQVIVDDISLYEQLDADGLARFRREYLGFIFQAFNLLPYLSAMENVLLPLAPLKIPLTEKKVMARKALEKVGLWDRRSHPPGNLSGGQQQRVAIARALVNEPLILFADEPTGNLDSRTKEEVMELFGDLNSQGHTLIMVTHDDSSLKLEDKVLQIKDGIVSGTGVLK